MGLREAKKRQLRARILGAAIPMIRERGYERTRVQDVAAAAEVSEATFFNYFSTKDALLTAWLGDLLHSAIAGAAERSAGRSLRHWVREFSTELAPRVAEDRALVKTGFARGGLDHTPVEAAVHRFRDGQTRGEIRADIQAEELAELFTGIALCELAAWVARPDDDPEPLGPRLLRGLNLLLDGCRKRNERVRAPAATVRFA